MARRVVEVKTLGYQQSRAGYGSSASAGDAYGATLEVPNFIPVSGDRFFFRLCAAEVAAGQRCKVLGYKFTTLIGRRFDVVVEGIPPNAWPYKIEREVVSPFWSFVDGNVTYYLRKVPRRERQILPVPVPPLPPSVQRGLNGIDAALLTMTYDPAARIYTPPAGGQPDGDPIAGLDKIYDQPAPWIDVSESSDYVDGPCTITAYATIKQTNHETRPFLPLASYPTGTLAQGLRPEDQFLLVWGESPTNNTNYTGVAAALRLEFIDKEAGCK